MNSRFSTDWTVYRLGELATKIQYGYTKKARQEKVGPRFLRITDIQNDSVDWSQVPFCEIDDRDKQKYLLRNGDLVFARTGATVGKSFLITGSIPESVFASYLIRVRLRTGIEPKYVSYFFRSSDYWRQISESQAGIGQPNVNGKKLAQIQIPVAPLDQQKSTVAEIEKQFSRLDEAVANLKRVKANLKRYKAAVLKAAVEGRLVETEAELARREGRSYETGAQLLQRILETRRSQWLACANKSGGKGKGKYKEPAALDTTNLPELPEGWTWATPEQLSAGEPYSLAIGPFGSSLKVSDYTNYGVPLVFVRNIRAASFGGPDNVYVTQEKAEELRAHWINGGDLLITKMGDPPGDVCIYPAHRPTAVVTADCIKLRLARDLIPTIFFAYAIESDLVHRQILSITKGVAQLKVSLSRFRTIGFPLPPIAEQDRIVAEVDRRLSLVRQVEAQVDAILKRSERLRQSILNMAFCGRFKSPLPISANSGSIKQISWSSLGKRC